MKLTTGQHYNPATLTCTGWTPGDGTGTDGYNVADYFSTNGRYLGPDEHGIEPEFEEDYSAYTVRVSTEPSYYVSECSPDAAERISRDICDLIERQFPGISTESYNDGMVNGGGAATTGPDADTVEEIDNWIAENWTAAL